MRCGRRGEGLGRLALGLPGWGMLGGTSVTSGLQCLLRFVLRIYRFRLTLEFHEVDLPQPREGAEVEELSGILVNRFLCHGYLSPATSVRSPEPSSRVPYSNSDEWSGCHSTCPKDMMKVREKWARRAGVAAAKIVAGKELSEADKKHLRRRHPLSEHGERLANTAWIVLKVKSGADTGKGPWVCYRKSDVDLLVGVPRAPGALYRGFPTREEVGAYLRAYQRCLCEDDSDDSVDSENCDEPQV